MTNGSLKYLLSKIDKELRRSISASLSASRHDPAFIDRLNRKKAARDWIENLHKAMRRGDVEEAIFSGMALGARLATFELWDVIISQRNIRESLKRARVSSAEVRRKQTSKRNAELAKQVWKANPTLTASECAEKVRLRRPAEMSLSTIRHIIGPFRPRSGRNLAGSA